MPLLRTYRVFISHAWHYDDDYDRVVRMLRNAPNFSWHNYSVPNHDPLHTKTDQELTVALRDQIRPTQIVLILAGMYVAHSLLDSARDRYCNGDGKADCGDSSMGESEATAGSPDSGPGDRRLDDGVHRGGDPAECTLDQRAFSPEEQKILLEQYRLYVQMTDNLSARRAMANQFYVTVLGAGVALFSLASERSIFSAIQPFVIAIIGIFGLILCASWWFILRSYRQLNSGRFRVIEEMEVRLPFAPYTREWELIRRRPVIGRYVSLTHIEQWAPIAFGFPYVLFFGYAVLRWLHWTG